MTRQTKTLSKDPDQRYLNLIDEFIDRISQPPASGSDVALSWDARAQVTAKEEIKSAPSIH